MRIAAREHAHTGLAPTANPLRGRGALPWRSRNRRTLCPSLPGWHRAPPVRSRCARAACSPSAGVQGGPRAARVVRAHARAHLWRGSLGDGAAGHPWHARHVPKEGREGGGRRAQAAGGLGPSEQQDTWAQAQRQHECSPCLPAVERPPRIPQGERSSAVAASQRRVGHREHRYRTSRAVWQEHTVFCTRHPIATSAYACSKAGPVMISPRILDWFLDPWRCRTPCSKSSKRAGSSGVCGRSTQATLN
jgi:hypothetical protein